MNNQIITPMYNEPHNQNGAMLFCYKSRRKNAKSEMININHLISKNGMKDEKIINQFINTLSSVFAISEKYNKNIEISCYVSKFKKASYENENLYCTSEKLNYKFSREKFYSFESCVNFIFSIYNLIYPYNEISINDIYNDKSIKYIISKYYQL